MIQKIKALTLLGVAATLLSQSTIAKEQFEITPYEARYSVVWRGMDVGESVHRFEALEDNKWRLASETEPHLGFLPYDYYESSTFTIKGAQVVPLEYEYNKQEGLKKKKGLLTFDYENKKVFNHDKDHPWETELLPSMFDELTQTLAMRQDLIEGKDNFTYHIVKDHKYRTYKFTVAGEEVLETELGKIKTLKLEHKHPRRNRQTMFWVSPEYDYLLIKMSQYRKGKLVGGGEIVGYEPLPTSEPS
tara:strand:+ start:1617 stop:2354 length:738 start_codon:yes stop_codon:yes gene_type:complete